MGPRGTTGGGSTPRWVPGTELDDDNRRRARRNVVSALSTLESLGYRSRPSPTYAQQAPSAQEQNEGWR